MRAAALAAPARALLDRDLLPDVVLRAGIRHLLRRRLAEEGADDEELRRSRRRSLESSRRRPARTRTADRNADPAAPGPGAGPKSRDIVGG